MVFKSGYITILGRPNVGKSTLMNAMIGSKIAAVTEKPQTTRNRCMGILSETDYQIIFLDTPGVFEPDDNFNKILVKNAEMSIADADVLYVMTEADRAKNVLNPQTIRMMEKTEAPKFLIINKVDKVKIPFNYKDDFKGEIDEGVFDEIIEISALKNYNLDKILSTTLKYLSEGPQFYHPDNLSDKDMRFLVQEIVREKIMRLTGEEVPYCAAVVTEDYKERENSKDYASCNIFVEHDSQKGILIGKSGSLLKKIGQESRTDIERLIGKEVYLELWVKVRKNWRKDEASLKEFGYMEKDY